MARSKYMIVLVFLVFFVMSLLTNILGPILPDIINSFHVSLTAAGFLAFAFFIAYGVMSIPAGFLMERFHAKPVMVWSFVASTLGALAFALFPGYRVAFVSWFAIGAAMAVLQVVVVPLLRVAGGEEHYAFNSTLSQLVFGSASFLSPRIYSYLVLNLSKSPIHENILLRTLRRLTPETLPWVSIYWIFTASSFLMVIWLLLSRFPPVKQTDDERAGSWDMYLSLARASGLALLHCDVCLHWLRTRDSRLDFEVSLHLPRVRSSDHRCQRRLLVLGTSHCGVCSGYGAVKVFR
jgi:fucose permease